ncbi:MAG: hypothetical protein INH41_09885, partial [Myxococcaceae bacterium]|nr:hypothetical protein [Myxococcaceae bacterium]
RAALIYEKTGDWQREIGALNEFVTKFSKEQKQVELVVDAKKRIGDAYEKLNKPADARKAWAAAADEFDRRALKPEANTIAADAAAYARFQLAEVVFAEFDKLKIAGAGKALENSLKAKKESVKKVNAAYDDVVKYKRAEWTLAAFYRKGHALERFAQAVLETPVPPEVKRLGEEAVVTYQDLLSTQTVALEDKAVENYAATIAEARKMRISNEWTKRTLEALNRFRPKDYPVLKEPKVLVAGDGTFSEGAISTIDGVKERASAQKLDTGDEK